VFTQGQAIEFIEKVFGPSIPSNKGLNVSVTCPVCFSHEKGTAKKGKKKLVIRTDNFLCHCWVCGYKSRNLIDLLKRYHASWLSEYLANFVGKKLLLPEDFRTDFREDEVATIRLPSDFVPLSFEIYNPQIINSTVASYLKNRLGQRYEEVCEYWGLGFSQNDLALRNRAIIPSFDAEGNLNYYTARGVRANTFPKYQNPNIPREDIVFNELNIDWSEPLLVVEGPFDLIMSYQPNATCLLGSTLSTDFLLFAKIIQNQTPVILALDRDASHKQFEIAKLLHSYGIEVRIVDIPEPWNDIAEMPNEEFKKELENARLYSGIAELLSKISKLSSGSNLHFRFEG
jgi:hypothetical protein